MKIEDSKYILYFFAIIFFGSVASNQEFQSLCNFFYTCDYEDRQSHFSDDSQNHNKDFYRRSYQGNHKIKNNKYVILAPRQELRVLINSTDKIYCSVFDDISISLTIKDLIYPFNYFF